jgi:hypothetical protein
VVVRLKFWKKGPPSADPALIKERREQAVVALRNAYHDLDEWANVAKTREPFAGGQEAVPEQFTDEVADIMRRFVGATEELEPEQPAQQPEAHGA